MSVLLIITSFPGFVGFPFPLVDCSSFIGFSYRECFESYESMRVLYWSCMSFSVMFSFLNLSFSSKKQNIPNRDSISRHPSYYLRLCHVYCLLFFICCPTFKLHVTVQVCALV